MEMANLLLRMCVIVSFFSLTAQADSNGEVSQNFKNEPSDIIAIEGSNVSLPCILEKPGSVRWLRNGICLASAVPNLEENEHYKIESNTSIDYTLQIFNLSQEDVGMYQCISCANDQQTIASHSALLLVFDVNFLRPPNLGDDFLRYVSMSDVDLSCHPVSNSAKDFQELSRYGDPTKIWMTATNDMQLNQVFNDLSGMAFTCTFRDQVLRQFPPISLTLKIAESTKLVLTSAIGSKESEELVCIPASAPESKISFNCFNLLRIDDEDSKPQLQIECEFNYAKVLTCTAKGADMTYTFLVCVAPNDLCQFDLSSNVPNSDLYVFTKTSVPSSPFLVWKKSKPSMMPSVETAVLKNARERCSVNQSQVVLQLEIDHENHNIPLEIPINIKHVDQFTRNCGLFQVTCFYWIWREKVFTILHEGIVIPHLCKVITLQIKMRVCDKSVLAAAASGQCILLNQPKSPHMLQQLSKIPNIYPIAGVICLSCVTILTMIYIGRRLLALYDRASRPRVRHQIERLAQVVPPHSQKKVYTRFMNEDETAVKKVTLI